MTSRRPDVRTNSLGGKGVRTLLAVGGIAALIITAAFAVAEAARSILPDRYAFDRSGSLLIHSNLDELLQGDSDARFRLYEDSLREASQGSRLDKFWRHHRSFPIFHQAYELIEDGEIEDALDNYDHYLEHDPDHLVMRWRQLIASASHGNHGRTEQYAIDLDKDTGGFSPARLLAGITALRQDNIPRARQNFVAAASSIDLHLDDRLLALVMLANSAVDDKNLTGALRDILARLSASDPAHELISGMQEIANFKYGDWQPIWRKASNTVSNPRQLLRLVVVASALLERTGAYEASWQVVQSALDDDLIVKAGGGPVARAELYRMVATYAYKSGNFAKALEVAIRIRDTTKDWSALTMIAYIGEKLPSSADIKSHLLSPDGEIYPVDASATGEERDDYESYIRSVTEYAIKTRDSNLAVQAQTALLNVADSWDNRRRLAVLHASEDNFIQAITVLAPALVDGYAKIDPGMRDPKTRLRVYRMLATYEVDAGNLDGALRHLTALSSERIKQQLSPDWGALVAVAYIGSKLPASTEIKSHLLTPEGDIYSAESVVTNAEHEVYEQYVRSVTEYAIKTGDAELALQSQTTLLDTADNLNSRRRLATLYANAGNTGQAIDVLLPLLADEYQATEPRMHDSSVRHHVYRTLATYKEKAGSLRGALRYLTLITSESIDEDQTPDWDALVSIAHIGVKLPTAVNVESHLLSPDGELYRVDPEAAHGELAAFERYAASVTEFATQTDQLDLAIHAQTALLEVADSWDNRRRLAVLHGNADNAGRAIGVLTAALTEEYADVEPRMRETAVRRHAYRMLAAYAQDAGNPSGTFEYLTMLKSDDVDYDLLESMAHIGAQLKTPATALSQLLDEDGQVLSAEADRDPAAYRRYVEALVELSIQSERLDVAIDGQSQLLALADSIDVRRRTAVLHARMGDSASAVELLQPALTGSYINDDDSTSTMAALRELVEYALTADNVPVAIAAQKTILNRGVATNLDTWMRLGELYRGEGDTDRAVAVLEQALRDGVARSKQDRTNVYLKLSELMHDEGRIDAAIANLENAYGVTRDVAIRERLVDRWLGSEPAEFAGMRLKMLARSGISVGDASLLMRRAGHMYSDAGLGEQAFNSFVEAFDFAPSPEALAPVFESARQHGLGDAAAAVAMRALDDARDPVQQAKLLDKLCDLYQQIGHLADLGQCLDQLITLRPNDEMLLRRALETASARGAMDERLGYMERLHGLAANNSLAEDIARAHIDRGDSFAARRWYQTSAQAGSVTAEIELAMLAIKSADLAGAQQQLEMLLQRPALKIKHRDSAVEMLGNLHYSQKAYRVAAKTWDSSSNPRLKLMGAQTLYEQRDYTATDRLLRKLRRADLKPNDRGRYFAFRAMVLEKLGRRELALDYWKRAVDTESTVDRLVGYADLLAKAGNASEARNKIHEASKLEPDNLAVTTTLAWLESRLGNNAVATRLFKRAIAAGAEDYRLHRALGYLYQKAGKRKDAATALGDALALLEKGSGVVPKDAPAVAKVITSEIKALNKVWYGHVSNSICASGDGCGTGDSGQVDGAIGGGGEVFVARRITSLKIPLSGVMDLYGRLTWNNEEDSLRISDTGRFGALGARLKLSSEKDIWLSLEQRFFAGDKEAGSFTDADGTYLGLSASHRFDAAEPRGNLGKGFVWAYGDVRHQLNSPGRTEYYGEVRAGTRIERGGTSWEPYGYVLATGTRVNGGSDRRVEAGVGVTWSRLFNTGNTDGNTIDLFARAGKVLDSTEGAEDTRAYFGIQVRF